VICKRLRITEAALAEMLKRLQQLQILDYRPATEKPKVFLYDPRHSRPVFNTKNLEPLKKARLQAIEQMQLYTLNKDCRAAWWIAYFTSKTAAACGHCDLCSRKKKSALRQKDNLPENIKEYINKHQPDYGSMLEWLPDDKAVKELRLLMDEGIIATDSEGKLIWAGR
jgi:superfamily II DNA helicase RecQ